MGVSFTSATIDTEKFKNFFNSGEPVVAYNEQLYPVEVVPVELGKGEHHTQGAIRAAIRNVLIPFATGELTIPGKTKQDSRTVVTSGAVPILLPGKEDISQATQDIQRTVQALRQMYQLYQTVKQYDGSEAERQQLIIIIRGLRTSLMSNEAYRTLGDLEIKIQQNKELLADLDSIVQTVASFPMLSPDKKVEILPCHGEMRKEEQQLVETDIPGNTLRFVPATEIVRSSVTIPSTIGVVDSLQIKRMFVDEHGVRHLGKVTVSGAEADQGKGRAGREIPGFYIPVSFNNEYGNITRRSSREYWPQPAIQREALTSVILQFASVGLSIRTLDLLDKPDQSKIDTAIERLKKLGALDEKEQITTVGELLLQFPIEPDRALTLITAEKFGVLPEAVIATAVLENEGLQFVPRADTKTAVVNEKVLRKILKEHKPRTYSYQPLDSSPAPESEKDILDELPSWVQRRDDGKFIIDTESYDFPLREGARSVAVYVWGEFAGESGSDFFASVQAYRAFKAEQRRLRKANDIELGFNSGEYVSNGTRQRRIEELERQWCFDHFINHKKLQFIDATVRDLRDEVNNSPLHLDNGISDIRVFSVDDLTKALLSGLVDNVAHRVSGDTYKGPMADDITKSSSSSLRENPEFILVGGVRKAEVKGRRGSREMHFADLVAPVQPDWFMQVMPQLCRQEILADTARYDQETGQVFVQQDTHYGVLKIKDEKIKATGELGTKVLAQAIIDGNTGHWCEVPNREKTARIKELLKRDRNDINFDEKLLNWYIAKLDGAIALADIRNLDLQLTDLIATELLGFDYPEFEERVLREKPDSVEFDGNTYQLQYYGSDGSTQPISRSGSSSPSGSRLRPSGSSSSRYYVALALPISVIKTLEWDKLPALEGFDIELSVTDENYSGQSGLKVKRGEENSLNTLRKNIEKRRLDLAWTEFANNKGMSIGSLYGRSDREVIDVAYEQPLPALPQPEVWDPITQTFAYPAHVMQSKYRDESGTKWVINWYKTTEEAQQAEAKAEEQRQQENTKEYEKLHFEQLKSEAQALYAEIEALFATRVFPRIAD